MPVCLSIFAEIPHFFLVAGIVLVLDGTSICDAHVQREAAKKVFFIGPATKRGGGGEVR